MTVHLAPVIVEDGLATLESEYILSPITLWPLGSIESIHILPSRLQLGTFLKAAGLAAGRMRGVAGRYQRRSVGEVTRAASTKNYTYFISLTDSPIPVEHIIVPSSSSLVPNVDVVRADLGAFISKVNVVAPANSDEFLLKIKITEEEEGDGRTILGFSWGHVLGDGATFNLFTTILSTIYSHLLSSPPSGSLSTSSLCLPRPTTTHLYFSPPTDEAIREFGLPQTDVLSIEEGSRKYSEGARGSEVIVFRLSKKELAILKEKSSGRSSKADASNWISTQDALSAWLVEVLRSCGVEVRDIVNSINYRSFPPSNTTNPLFPVPLTYLVGNVAQMRASPIPSPSSPPSLLPTARALRRDLLSLKNDPQRMYDWLSVQAERLGRATDEGKMHCVLPEEGSVMVNSNLRYDWNLLFGYPEGTTSYHTSFSGHHFLRVFQPNPSSTSIGGGAELNFTVRSEMKAQVLEVMESDRSTLWSRFD